MIDQIQTPHARNIDTSLDMPRPWLIGDLQPMEYGYGNTAGETLMIDFFDWHSQLSEADKGYADQCVRRALDEAYEQLGKPFSINDGFTHRGIAVGFIQSVVFLLSKAFENPDLKQALIDLRRNNLELCEESNRMDAAESRAQALDIQRLCKQAN
jgi:hypothetical protein